MVGRFLQITRPETDTITRPDPDTITRPDTDTITRPETDTITIPDTDTMTEETNLEKTEISLRLSIGCNPFQVGRTDQTP